MTVRKGNEYKAMPIVCMRAETLMIHEMPPNENPFGYQGDLVNVRALALPGLDKDIFTGLKRTLEVGYATVKQAIASESGRAMLVDKANEFAL